MKIAKHRLYTAYLLIPIIFPFLLFYVANKTVRSDVRGGFFYFQARLGQAI